MNKDQAYHQIALACLKSLRESNAANSKDQAQELYDAIDEGFQNQFALVMAELEDAKQRLSLINQLDPKQHSLADAQAIINAQGTAH
ncbi:MAG: hypothetical protein MK185_01975 [Saccharospirillaceae bacterium]|nr:hypothetical protein A3759_18750 [Thalassolituus sp. HI0120]KZZ46351.1 hypothetical protein A3759_06550 [Thalassolituus sp. HI0120]MCH2039389.1 hypothetical protein [Saccharospirillaceae bacterium]